MPVAPAHTRAVRRGPLAGASIRSARKSDVKALVRVENSSFRDYYRPHRFTEDDFLRYLGKPNTLALVARARRTVVGYALGPAPLAGHPRTARLDSIAVVPAERGRGAGGHLLRRFMRLAKARGCRRVSLEVAVPNVEARRLFEHADFRSTRRLTRYYSSTADAVRLRAAL